MTERTPAQMRAEAEADLQGPGGKRVKLLAQLSELDETLRPLVIRAVAMEVPLRKIQSLTGVSPNTARAWAAKG